MTKELKAFYDREYFKDRYANIQKPENHPFYTELISFISKYQLYKKKCLEIDLELIITKFQKHCLLLPFAKHKRKLWN